MKSVFTFLLSLLLLCPALAYQAKDVLVAKIDNYQIRSSELLYAYQKNRASSEVIEYDSLEKYLEQYINFKLKVIEARAQGYDTISVLKEELQGYVSQIRKPYLDNEEPTDKLIRETYNRMHVEIDASHILINVKTDALPKDTVSAYQLIDSLRLAVKSREQFEELAKKFSQDGSAQLGGNLGWFSAMDMVAPFEDVAYKTATGKVSAIARTRFGYHIVYINRKRTSRGKLKTSHIFFNTQNRSESQVKVLANSVYDSLKVGAKWNDITRRYSDDTRTKMQGGQLPLARIKQVPDDFMDIAYSLKEIGDISKPSKTQFGWHIVRLDEVEPTPAFDEIAGDILESLKRSGRNSLNEEQLIKKLKSENEFLKYDQTLKQVISALTTLNKDSISVMKEKALLAMKERVIRVKDFVDFLPSQNIALGKDVLYSLYQEFEKSSILAYEDSLAPTKYPEYGHLLKEYQEGILLFEIMQKEVWNKGIKDTLGAKTYYLKNIDQYQVEKRFSVQSISGLDSVKINSLKAVTSQVNTEISIDSLAKKHFSNEELGLLKIVKRTIKASEIPSFETTELKSGSWLENTGTGEHFFIDEVIPAGPYKYEEIRGLVISDFQDYLNQEWIKKLRKKRQIKVYRKVLKNISKN